MLELGRVFAAREVLERALVLSPFNAQYQTELAYTWQMEKNWTQALAQYQSAVEAANFSPEEAKVADQTRALRGQGYALIEMGKLDEAEEKYKKCLELDGNDRDAMRELQYIEQLRQESK